MWGPCPQEGTRVESAWGFPTRPMRKWGAAVQRRGALAEQDLEAPPGLGFPPP